jgi:Pyruvate/2-oxoacid:ferredoxin oxidoreductase delta subunit
MVDELMRKAFETKLTNEIISLVIGINCFTCWMYINDKKISNNEINSGYLI